MSKQNPLEAFLSALSKKPSTSRSFSMRQTQRDMMRSVYGSFETKHFAVIEAPTGTGKSLGYLIPSLLKLQQEAFHLTANVDGETTDLEPVVVSTATLTLQNQLLEKDIPTALKLIKEKKLKAFVLKGRSNYLCRNRLTEYLKRSPELNERQEEQLNVIREWAEETSLGDKAELPLNPDGELWSHICGDPTICVGLRCGAGDQCFFYHNKKEAASAALIIVNHKLLAHDLAIKSVMGLENELNAILPHTTRLIIDEAHKFPADLEDAYAVELSYAGLAKTLNRIDPDKKGNLLAMGLFATQKSLEKVRECIREIRVSWRDAENYLISHFNTIPSEDSFLSRAPFKLFNTSLWNSDIYRNYLDMGSNTLGTLKELVAELELIRKPFKDEKGSESLLAELNSFVVELGNFTLSWGKFFRSELGEDLPYSRWVERKTQGTGYTYLTFHLHPLEIGGLLQSKVYPHIRSLVLTSATLSIQGNFTSFLNSLGLQGDLIRERVVTQSLPTSFDPKHVLFTTAVDFPAPESGQAYFSYILPLIHQLIQLNMGGTLILATSYDMVQKIHLGLLERGLKLPIYSQGNGEDNNQILAHFKRKTRSVLIGTDSFWEGVDVPGDALTLVIIPKLPFNHPQDPVHYTKKQYLTNVCKMNAFVSYDVPHAILKFKQGFGRLMRQADDWGAVVCLDSRLTSKPYGRTFISSMEPHQHEALPSERVFSRVKTFFAHKK